MYNCAYMFINVYISTKTKKTIVFVKKKNVSVIVIRNVLWIPIKHNRKSAFIYARPNYGYVVYPEQSVLRFVFKYAKFTFNMFLFKYDYKSYKRQRI